MRTPDLKQKRNRRVRSSELVMRLTKALKMALMIIRNDAMAREHSSPQAFNARMRWCEELEVEAGLRKPHNDKITDGGHKTHE